MTLSLPVTIAIFAAGLGLFAFATWRVRQPAEPLKVRMVNYVYVQLFAILVVLLMAAHILSFMGITTGTRGMR
jgi:hypothetical protein